MESGRKRASRFDDAEAPALKKPSVDVSAAAARAAEISRELASKIAQVSTLVNNVMVAKATALPDRKAKYRPLLLDAQGRAIDENGNLVKNDTLQIKTLAANVAVEKDLKKKENPYLAHRAPVIVAAVTAQTADATPSVESDQAVDDRLPKAGRRDLKVKKSLQFIAPGQYVREEEKAQHKEERKLIAGYASGRKNLEHKGADAVEGETSEDAAPVTAVAPVAVLSVAPPLDVVTPSMEWWDEAFLPKDTRESRRISKAAADRDDFALLAAGNNKTHRYVQHPVPVKPLGGDKGPLQSLPMFLTKKEQKKLRKATRAEREREKRDKQMMGLIPAPEPKFTLSNFMKVLGDQAVADPSKVELRVMQQMQQRVLNHEMRNAAAKLTPKERKEKKARKLHEDTSRSVSVAAFRVTDFSNLKHRFKVDVNAQQHFLSGTVLLCQDPPTGLNLVVAEGGPKGIRKFVRLMTERIRWADSSAAGDHFHANNGDDGGGDDDSDDEDDEEEGEMGGGANADDREQGNKYSSSSSSGAVDGGAARDNSGNRCDLLWSGVLPKRSFTGFKFQEAKSALACRRLLEGKGLGHYWDMCEKADESRLSAALPEDDFSFG